MGRSQHQHHHQQQQQQELHPTTTKLKNLRLLIARTTFAYRLAHKQVYSFIPFNSDRRTPKRYTHSHTGVLCTYMHQEHDD